MVVTLTVTELPSAPLVFVDADRQLRERCRRAMRPLRGTRDDIQYALEVEIGDLVEVDQINSVGCGEVQVVRPRTRHADPAPARRGARGRMVILYFTLLLVSALMGYTTCMDDESYPHETELEPAELLP